MNGLTIKNNIENKLDARADRDIKNKKLKHEAKEILYFLSNQFNKKDSIKVLNMALKKLDK